MKKNFLVALVLSGAISCIDTVEPPPPPEFSETGPINLIFFPDWSSGFPGCNWNRFDKHWVYIEIWAFDFTSHQHVKYGSTIKRSENDYNPNGELVINVPKEGTYYLDVTIVKDCDYCCGSTSTEPERCDESRGKPEWRYLTPPAPWKPWDHVNVNFNQCRCEC